ncbi:MAG: hypothetical protein VCD00_04635 [Candidatus Hydrogenedentota bacterium]
MKLWTWTVMCFALVLTWDISAYAYLDGASGSVIVQILIGGIAGMGILIKMFGQSVMAKLGLRKPADAEEDVAEPEQPET